MKVLIRINSANNYHAFYKIFVGFFHWLLVGLSESRIRVAKTSHAAVVVVVNVISGGTKVPSGASSQFGGNHEEKNGAKLIAAFSVDKTRKLFKQDLEG